MTDHDPGDEDRRDVGNDTCPFCGRRLHWRQTWKTTVVAYDGRPLFSIFEAQPPSPDDAWGGEVLTTCVDCKSVARSFAIEQRRNWDEKRAARYRREYERRMGVAP